MRRILKDPSPMQAILKEYAKGNCAALLNDITAQIGKQASPCATRTTNEE